MALGEAACVSVHGANRLGSNSLIDLVVFGRAAGLRCAEMLSPDEKHADLPKDPPTWRSPASTASATPMAARRPPSLRDRMQMHDAEQLRRVPHRRGAGRGQDAHPRGLARRGRHPVTDRSLIWNTDLIETLEFDNLIGQAVVTMDCAANRTECRGAHAREDFPDRDDKNWMKHTLAWLDETTHTVTIDYRPVHTYTMSNDVQYIEPKARVY